MAVSGGRDSVALVHWLTAQRWHTSLVVCHVNHALRGNDSGQDAALVRRVAKKLGWECEIEKVDTRELAESCGRSIETVARAVRHTFFQQMAEKHGASWVYLAHHAEDQAETILANLCRGCGLNGVAGMKDEQALENGLLLKRPLLEWRREQIHDYIREHKLPFRDDASNASPEFRRNRLRHEALPLLNEIFDRDVTESLLRFAKLSAEDEACLQEQARDLEVISDDGSLRVTEAVKSLPGAILNRLLRHWLRERAGVKDVGQAEVGAARAMLNEVEMAKVNLPGGRHLRRKAKRMWVE